MPNYFTQYWTNAQWDGSVTPQWRYWTNGGPPEGMEFHKLEKLDHTAGELFNRVGVRPGDVIFVVTVKKGRLLLGGRIVVGKICGQREAEETLKAAGRIYDATEHIIAADKPDRFRPDNEVPHSVVERLAFEGKDGRMTLKFKAPGILDQQTLRGVRRLTEASAKLLTDALKVKAR